MACSLSLYLCLPYRRPKEGSMIYPFQRVSDCTSHQVVTPHSSSSDTPLSFVPPRRRLPGIERKKKEKIDLQWNRSKKEKTKTDLKKEEKLKSTGLCIFLLLQVTGILTASRKGKRGGSRSRSPGFLDFFTAAWEFTPRQWWWYKNYFWYFDISTSDPKI